MQRIPRTRSKRDPFAAVFQQLAYSLRKETHTDASLFAMIAHLIPRQPDFAATLCANIGRVLSETADPVDYVEVHVEAYRRTLFAPNEDHGGPSIDMFAGDPALAQEFVDTLLHILGAAHVQPHSPLLN